MLHRCLWIVAIALSLSAVGATAQDYEYEPDEGMHQEEWYDPSDWWDTDDSVSYEDDWYDDDYYGDDDYGYYGAYDEDYDYYNYGYDDYYEDDYYQDYETQRAGQQNQYGARQRQYGDQRDQQREYGDWQDRQRQYDYQQDQRDRQRQYGDRDDRQRRMQQDQWRRDRQRQMQARRDQRRRMRDTGRCPVCGHHMRDRQQRQQRFGRDQMQRRGRYDQISQRRQQDAMTRATHLTGTAVMGPQGERIGKLKDLILDAERGQVSFGVVCPSDNDRQCRVIPWTMMSLRRDGQMLRVNMSRRQFGEIPQLNPDQISEDMGADAFNREVTRFWQQRTGGGVRQQGHPIRLSELTGKSVQDAQGEDVGDIEDVVLSVRQGELLYALVSLVGQEQQGQQKMAAVPFELVSCRPEQESARIDASQQRIQRLSYRQGEEPDFGSRQFQRRAEQEYGPVYVVRSYAIYLPAEQRRRQQQRDWRDQRDQRDQQQWRQQRDEVTASSWRQFRQQHAQGQNQVQVQGTVQSVGSFRPSGQNWQSVRLRIQTEQGQSRVVLVGPRDRIEQEDIDLTAGDQITIRGSQASINDRSMIVASRVSKDGQTLNLEP